MFLGGIKSYYEGMSAFIGVAPILFYLIIFSSSSSSKDIKSDGVATIEKVTQKPEEKNQVRQPATQTSSTPENEFIIENLRPTSELNLENLRPGIEDKSLGAAPATSGAKMKVITTKKKVPGGPKCGRGVSLGRPVKGHLKSRFGMRKHPIYRARQMHYGVDFSAPSGRKVVAGAAGKVIRASWMGTAGKVVFINHGEGVITKSFHLLSIKVKVGQKVKKGQPVGRVGSTGASTGPHLHYELVCRGRRMNPMLFINRDRWVKKTKYEWSVERPPTPAFRSRKVRQ